MQAGDGRWVHPCRIDLGSTVPEGAVEFGHRNSGYSNIRGFRGVLIPERRISEESRPGIQLQPISDGRALWMIGIEGKDPFVMLSG